MNCNIIKDLIPSYIDGLLSDESKKLVDNHIESCEECKKYIEICTSECNVLEEINKKELREFMKFYGKFKRNSRLFMICIVLILVLAGSFRLYYCVENPLEFYESKQAYSYNIHDGRLDIVFDFGFHTRSPFNTEVSYTLLSSMDTVFIKAVDASMPLSDDLNATRFPGETMGFVDTFVLDISGMSDAEVETMLQTLTIRFEASTVGGHSVIYDFPFYMLEGKQIKE